MCTLSTRLAGRIILWGMMVVCLLFLPAGSIVSSQNLSTPETSLSPATLTSSTDYFILYSRSDSTIWIKDKTGDQQIINGLMPRMSPNRQYFAYTDSWGDGDLYVYDMNTLTAAKVFTNNCTWTNFSWTPYSDKLVFDCDSNIISIDRNGANPTVLVGPSWPVGHGALNDAPNVNPVDGRITFMNWDTTPALMLADANGANPRYIPNTRHGDGYPVWSPDGEWIAFMRDYDDIYKIRPDGTGLTRLTFTQGSGYMTEPGGSGAWTQDGKWLVLPVEYADVISLYAVSTSGSGLMFKINTAAGAEPDYVGTVQALFTTGGYLPVIFRN